MKQTLLMIFAVLMSSTAFADYDFSPEWNAPGNNDQANPNTNAPYTQGEIRTFLDGKADRNAIEEGRKALAVCGKITVKKGCHQANARHVTIYIDGRVKANQVRNCLNYNNSSYHIDGC